MKICGTHADGSELEAVGVLSESDLEAARQDAVSARTTATKFSDPPRNPDCRDGLNGLPVSSKFQGRESLFDSLPCNHES